MEEIRVILNLLNVWYDRYAQILQNLVYGASGITVMSQGCRILVCICIKYQIPYIFYIHLQYPFALQENYQIYYGDNGRKQHYI